MLNYFAQRGAACDENVNPAEHIVDVVQDRNGDNVDWPNEWLESVEYKQTLAELDALNDAAITNGLADEEGDDTRSFATPKWYQMKLVTQRQAMSLWRVSLPNQPQTNLEIDIPQNPDCRLNLLKAIYSSRIDSGVLEIFFKRK